MKEVNKNILINSLYSIWNKKKKLKLSVFFVSIQGMPIKLRPELQVVSDVHQINIIASGKIATNRSLPELRDPKCLDIRYPKLLPSVSIIIAFHKEASSILQRAILSVINRSPNELIEELILVDDFSENTHLKEQLNVFIASLSQKVNFIETEKREGLIRARMIGAEQAKVGNDI